MKIKICHYRADQNRKTEMPAVTEIDLPYALVEPFERLAAAMERIADAMERLGQDEENREAEVE